MTLLVYGFIGLIFDGRDDNICSALCMFDWTLFGELSCYHFFVVVVVGKFFC
jgi:hypothetical protein